MRDLSGHEHAVGQAEDAFSRDVRDALLHLYDVPYLGRHRLANILVSNPSQADTAVSAGSRLRERLIGAIDSLKPQGKVAEDSKANRGHQIAHLRYVEAKSAAEVQRVIGLGNSQYHVEHDRAFKTIVALLREGCEEHGAAGESLPGTRRATLSVRPPPRPLSKLVGRERELATLRAAFGCDGQEAGIPSNARLLTVTGPAGVGKTRLALEFAAELATSDRTVHYVQLAQVTEPGMLMPTVSHSLAIPIGTAEAATAALSAALGPRRLLLLLDDFDHLSAAGADIEELLRACPELNILITSRTSLDIQGGCELAIQPLATASARAEDVRSCEAVRLFLLRAREASLSFDPDDGALAQISSICSRLDGLPLAIELAAARIRSLSLAEILRRLDEGFAVISAGQRVPDRRRTLLDAIDLSYELLSPRERVLFNRLSVFRETWTLPAAQAVCAGDGLDQHAVEDLLSQLINKSMVIAEIGRNAPRYRMLTVLRQYAADKLRGSGEADAVHERHVEWVARSVLGEFELTRDGVLAGASTRRGHTVLALIEQITARVIAGRHGGSAEPDADPDDSASRFFGTFAPARTPLTPATMEQIDACAYLWAPAVPQNPRLQAMVLHALVEKYAPARDSFSTLWSVLGAEEPAVRQAHLSLYGVPVD